MKISIVGSGYVGLVSGACLADVGNDVLCMDADHTKIDDLKEGDPVVVPAFGTEVGITDQLNARGCTVIDATCGD